MFGVIENTLHTIEDELYNTISIHCTKLSRHSTHHRDHEPSEKERGTIERNFCLGKEANKGLNRNENAYSVDSNVRQVGSGFQLPHVVQWYKYSKTADTAEPLSHIR